MRLHNMLDQKNYSLCSSYREKKKLSNKLDEETGTCITKKLNIIYT